LIAESTGKQGKGILPVDGEQPLNATAYGDDRLFVHIRIDESHDDQVDALIAAGLPLLQLTLDGKEDLGAAFYYWEVATAIAGHLMDIHPFDQPDVEAAKVLARDMVQTYMEQGALPAEQSACSAGPLTVYGAGAPTTPLEALEALWSGGDSPAQYVAIQAYLPSTPELESLLGSLRRVIYERSGMATTLGYGPRFLHSTGQLHKGDAGRGLFLQLTADSKTDAPIPDTADTDASSLSFGVLLAAQAHGDGQALRQADRTTLRLHLGEDAASGLHYLLAQFAKK
jgi:transaldolase/glucose-6-phosphate isomerase